MLSLHSISILKEELNDMEIEKAVLERVDKEKSAERIIELSRQIKDLDFSIEVLEDTKKE